MVLVGATTGSGLRTFSSDAQKTWWFQGSNLGPLCVMCAQNRSVISSGSSEKICLVEDGSSGQSITNTLQRKHLTGPASLKNNINIPQKTTNIERTYIQPSNTTTWNILKGPKTQQGKSLYSLCSSQHCPQKPKYGNNSSSKNR